MIILCLSKNEVFIVLFLCLKMSKYLLYVEDVNLPTYKYRLHLYSIVLIMWNQFSQISWNLFLVVFFLSKKIEVNIFSPIFDFWQIKLFVEFWFRMSGGKTKMADSGSKSKMATCPGSTRSLLFSTIFMLTSIGEINKNWINSQLVVIVNACCAGASKK